MNAWSHPAPVRNMRRRGRTAVTAVVVVVLCTTLAVVGRQIVARADAHPITVDGQFLCHDPNLGNIPLSGARVELYDAYNTPFGHLADNDITVLDQQFGTSHTNADGTFSVSGDRGQASDVYVRIVLNDDHGVQLVNGWGNDESYSSFHFTIPKYTHIDSGTVHLGSFVIQPFKTAFTGECPQFIAAKRAFDNYSDITGKSFPGGQFAIVEAPYLTFGVPWTSLQESTWAPDMPSGPVEYTTSTGVGIPATMLHEFGHALRHSFDGDVGHWLGDVAAYTYLQQHTFCQRTNPGFAFNEGWAEFWANNFSTGGCTPGDMSQEGNVAASLKNLADKCLAGSADTRRKKMVSVLENAGPFAIHSFDDFLNFFNNQFNGCIEHYAQLSSTFHFTGEAPGDVLPVATQLGRLQDEQTADAGQLTALDASLQDALNHKKALGGSVTCVGTPCLDAFDTIVTVPLLQAKIAQVKLLTSWVKQRVNAVGKPDHLDSPDTYYKRRANDTTFTHKNVMLAYNGFKHALAATSALVATDATGQLSNVVEQLRRRMEQLATLATDASGTVAPPQWVGPQLLAEDTVASAMPASLSVAIASPANGAGITDPNDCIDPTANVELTAIAIDPTAGALSGSQVHWSDTLNGSLGDGSAISRPLVPVGGVTGATTDTITVVATNVQGQVATASTTVCLDTGGG